MTWRLGASTTDPDDLAVGESTISRKQAAANSGGAITLATGTLRLGYFTARRTEDINFLRCWPGNTAAAATPTLLRWGIYEVASDGGITLAASIANATTVFASTSSSAATYKKAVENGPWVKRAGQRYAVGIICVTAATAPTIIGALIGGSAGNLNDLAPRLAGTVNGQTDLPASLAVGSISGGAAMPFCEMLPS